MGEQLSSTGGIPTIPKATATGDENSRGGRGRGSGQHHELPSPNPKKKAKAVELHLSEKALAYLRELERQKGMGGTEAETDSGEVG